MCLSTMVTIDDFCAVLCSSLCTDLVTPIPPVCLSVCVFFFKQETAYEMRSRDWSSDVCSSDLSPWAGAGRLTDGQGRTVDFTNTLIILTSNLGDRKSVVEGKSVSVRVDIGGRRIIKKKKTLYT